MHAQHAGVGGIISVKCPLTHQRVTDRGIHQSGKYRQFLRRSRDHSSSADKDIGTPGGSNHADGLFQALLTDLLFLFGQRRQWPVLKGCCGRSHILGDIHQNRAGTSALCNCKGPAQGVGQPAHVLDDKIVLGDGHGNPGNIHLLEGILAQKRDSDIAGDSDQGHGVHISGRDSRDQVGRARPGRGQADSHPAGCPRVAVCGV